MRTTLNRISVFEVDAKRFHVKVICSVEPICSLEAT